MNSEKLIYSNEIRVKFQGKEDKILETLIIKEVDFGKKRRNSKIICFLNPDSDSSFIALEWFYTFLHVEDNKIVFKENLMREGETCFHDIEKVGKFIYYLILNPGPNLLCYDPEIKMSSVAAGNVQGFKTGSSMRSLLNERAIVVTSKDSVTFFTIDPITGILYLQNSSLDQKMLQFEVQSFVIFGNNQEYLCVINNRNPLVSIFQASIKNGKIKIKKWMDIQLKFQDKEATYYGDALAYHKKLNFLAVSMMKFKMGGQPKITDSIQFFKLDTKKRKVVFRRVLQLDHYSRNPLYCLEFYKIVKGKLIIVGMPIHIRSGILSIWSFAFDLETNELMEFSEYEKKIKCDQFAYRLIKNSGNLINFTSEGNIIKINYS